MFFHIRDIISSGKRSGRWRRRKAKKYGTPRGEWGQGSWRRGGTVLTDQVDRRIM